MFFVCFLFVICLLFPRRLMEFEAEKTFMFVPSNFRLGDSCVRRPMEMMLGWVVYGVKRRPLVSRGGDDLFKRYTALDRN
jgi:hypothetical protein